MVELRQKGEIEMRGSKQKKTNAQRDCFCNLDKCILLFGQIHFGRDVAFVELWGNGERGCTGLHLNKEDKTKENMKRSHL